MADVKLYPWTGIDNVSAEPNLLKGAVRDAVNLVFDRKGTAERRQGYAVVRPGASSVWAHPASGRLYFVEAGELTSWDPASSNAPTTHGAASPDLEYLDLNGVVVFSSLTTLGQVIPGGAEGLGVEDASPPLVYVDEAGGLDAGTYGVVITFLTTSRTEGAASEAVFLDVPQGGGIAIGALPIPNEAKVTHLRFYRTAANGTVFYNVGGCAVGENPGLLGKVMLGRQADTRNLRRMRGGRYPRLWNGRLLVARGNVLIMSQALRYGLTDPVADHVSFASRITFIEPGEDGVYVGQRDGVVFLAGADAGKWKLETTSAGAPAAGSSLQISGQELDGKWVEERLNYAVWLGARGYAFGGAGGKVTEPSAKRLSLSVGQRGATVARDRRLVSVLQ